MTNGTMERKEFRTIRGLLIGDTLLRDILPERVELTKELTGHVEPGERLWQIQLHHDEVNRLTHIAVLDVAYQREHRSFP